MSRCRRDFCLTLFYSKTVAWSGCIRTGAWFDLIRHLHSLDGDDLTADFNGVIEYDLMSAPRMGRDPGTQRVMPILAMATLIAAVWEHEKELLAAEQ